RLSCMMRASWEPPPNTSHPGSWTNAAAPLDREGTDMTKTFAVSGQHYLFDVQTFAHVVLALGGDGYAYALRDRTTRGVIEDVASGNSDLGVLFQTSATADALNAAFDEAGLEFVEL